MSNRDVMLIDDDRRNIFALSAVLKSRGYSVITFDKMEDALEGLSNILHPAVILMDMMMPGIDGYQAIPILRRDEKLKSTPIIAVTAQAMQGDRERCLEAGADEYLSKPVDVDRLADLLQKYVQ